MDVAIDQRLGIGERFALESHLDGCPECARRWKELSAIEEGFQRLAAPPFASVDVDRAVGRIAARVAETPEPRRETGWRIDWRAAAVLFAAGAGVLGLVYSRSAEEIEAKVAQMDTEPAETVELTIEVGDELAPQRAVDANAVLRRYLAESFAEIDPAHDSIERIEVAALEFEDRAADLGRFWPLRRAVEAYLEGEDAGLACAALRYVGVRGDRISAVVLRRSLGRGDRARSAVQALGDLGANGLNGLIVALDEEQLFRVALERIVGIGGLDAARSIETRLGLEHEQDAASQARRVDLLAGLEAMGTPAIESLLRLADSPGRYGLTDDYLLAIEGIQGASQVLVAALDEEPRRWASEALLDAVALLQPDGALPRLGELCQDALWRGSALACLAEWRSAEPLDELVGMWAAGRVGRSDVIDVTTAIVEADAAGAAEYARGLTDRVKAAELLDLLLAIEDPAVGPALAELALGELLPTDERLFAALAVGELSDHDGMLRLARGFAIAQSTDRRLFAAGLITIHAVGGPAEARRVLLETEDDPERALRALAQSDGGALGVYRVARELGDKSASRNPRSGRPIL